MNARVGILGYGAVAAVHARALARLGAPAAVVAGPSIEKAEAFARANSIARATCRVEELLEACDAVVIASPSDFHFEQARQVLQAGRHCLLELPPCSKAIQARMLGYAAHAAQVRLECAHTSRFLAGFVRARRVLATGELGRIRMVTAVRTLAPRGGRSWIDDAVLHHAAHYLDLLLHWFGELKPRALVESLEGAHAQDAVLAATLGDGAPVSISVSYGSRLPQACVTLVGECHTLETDGFSFVRSDAPALAWTGEANDNYESAIEAQDRAFLQGVAGRDGGTNWEDTLRLAECLERFLNGEMER